MSIAKHDRHAWDPPQSTRTDPSRAPTVPDLPTHEYLPQLVANGACLYLRPSILSMPIPLIDMRFNGERLIIWATIQTPFGKRKPLFGLVNYASQTRLEYGSALEGPNGDRLCIIVDVRVLAIPDYTRDKLIRKAQEHAKRLREDVSYRRTWDQYFEEGMDDCVNKGQ